MDCNDIIVIFSSLEVEEKISVLARLALELTILARDTYAVDSESVLKPGQLRAYNDIQHKLLGQLCKFLAHDPKRYPDDVFFTIITDMAEQGEFLAHFQATLEKIVGSHEEALSRRRAHEAIFA